MNVTLKIDTREFHAARLKAMEFARGDLADELNTNMFFIGRRATWLTEKASAAKLAAQFGQAVKVRFSEKKRKLVRAGGSSFHSMIGEAPRLAVIINARRAKAGKKGLEGKDMEKAMNVVFAARMKSIGYIKSGYLPGIAMLEPYAIRRGGKPPIDRTAKKYGRAKGGASVARKYWVTSASIWNTAFSRRDKRRGFYPHGEPGLQAAVDEETRGLKERIANKMLERARRLGIKTG